MCNALEIGNVQACTLLELDLLRPLQGGQHLAVRLRVAAVFRGTRRRTEQLSIESAWVRDHPAPLPHPCAQVILAPKRDHHGNLQRPRIADPHRRGRLGKNTFDMGRIHHRREVQHHRRAV